VLRIFTAGCRVGRQMSRGGRRAWDSLTRRVDREPKKSPHGRVAYNALPIFGTLCHFGEMIVIGTGLVESYFANHAGHKGIKAARSQYEAWIDIVSRAQWSNPEDVKTSYPKASILKASRVVFNIKGKDYRLVAALQYRAGAAAIRFFGAHGEYDRIDAETV
jgi:mRNA interferase HigB